MTAGDLDAVFRMPVVFGPAPGPRNVPLDRRSMQSAGRTTRIGTAALTDEGALRALLPPNCTLRGEPVLSVTYARYENLGWLAGRGYDIVRVSFAATFRGAVDTVDGEFIAVVWESLADPIITGRDELGYPKLWADLSATTAADDSWRCSVDWLGFRFLDLWASPPPGEEGDGPSTGGVPADPGETLVYKYLPRCGDLTQPDVAYVAASPPSKARVVDTYARREAGFRFFAPSWEQMPTQYPIVTALASLPVHEFRDGFLECSSGTDAGAGQRILN